MKFDEILEEIGEFGPYQKRFFFLLTLPVIIPGIQVMSVIFTYDIPNYRCAIPSYDNDTYALQNSRHASIIRRVIPPGDKTVYSGCNVYTPVSNMSTESLLSVAMVDGNVSLWTNDTQACSKRVFDRSDMKSTVITEFDLVCGREVLRSHSNMLAFVGALVGSLCMGIVADVFGRKIAIMIGLGLCIVYSFLTFFSTSVEVVMGIRVIQGIGGHALFAIPATTAIELVGPSKRSFVGAMSEIFWAIGVLLVLPLAYLVREWRYIQLVIGIVTVPLISLWWLIPESPRWLLEKGRTKEVEVVLQKVCQANKCKLPPGAISDDTSSVTEAPKVSFLAMFTSRVLIIRSAIIFFNWLAVNLFYYGLSLNITNLDGSPYLNYLLAALVELAGYIFCLWAMPRFGRKSLHIAVMTLGGVSCLGVIPVLLLNGGSLTINILALLGKFCSSVCYTLLYVMSSELFPTSVRNSAIGACSIFENVGGIISPYIADLGLLVKGPMSSGISMIAFGAITITAAILTFLLPETLNRELPETLQDAIDFDKKKDKKTKYTNVKTDFELATVT